MYFTGGYVDRIRTAGLNISSAHVDRFVRIRGLDRGAELEFYSLSRLRTDCQTPMTP